MGVRSDPIGEPVPAASLVKVAAPLVPAATVAASAPHGYVLDGRLNDSYRAVFLLLAKGVGVRRVNAGTTDGRIRAGDFLVPPGDVAAIARQAGVDFVAATNPVPANMTALKAPRIGLFQRYRGGNMDEGWTRLLFEQFDVPFTSVRDADLKAGGLQAKFDVIVLPADSIAAMTGDDPPGGTRGGGGGGEGGDAGQRRTPPEFRSGFGADGVKALQAFVEEGGTLVTFGQAADLPVQRFTLPVRNVVAGVPSKEFWAPGSTLKVRYANDHPLAYGMPAEGLALFMAGSQAYEVTSTDRSQDVAILATYVERDLLQSGWLIGEQVIARKAAAVAVAQGKGRVVLIGFRPQNRAQTHGTFKLVFNALLTER